MNEDGECGGHTNYPFHHHSSWSCLDQHRRDLIWRSSGGDGLRARQCRQRERRGHGRCACEIESLQTKN